MTIISINCITNSGHSILFEGSHCKIKNPKGQIVSNIPANTSRLYKVEHAHLAQIPLDSVNLPTLHRKLGHILVGSIHALVHNHIISGIQLIDTPSPIVCESCEHAKVTCKPISKECSAPLAKTFGAEIHSDIWGPSLIPSQGGKHYYVTFTDDYSQWTRIYLIQTKDETLLAYKSFTSWAQTQFSTTIKHLRSDCGGKYTGNEFESYLQQQGTEHHLTTHDTPQHNGVAEALNCRLLEHVLVMLHMSYLPKMLWAEAIHHAVWLKNCTSTCIIGKSTPFK